MLSKALKIHHCLKNILVLSLGFSEATDPQSESVGAGSFFIFLKTTDGMTLDNNKNAYNILQCCFIVFNLKC